MSNYIPQIDFLALSSALGIDRNQDDFILYEGLIPSPPLRTPARRDYYLFLCLESGIIRLTMDLQPYEVRKSEMLFLRSSQIIRIESISPGAKGKIVAFRTSLFIGEHGRFLARLSFVASVRSPVISLQEGEATSTFNSISEIKRKLEDRTRPHRQLIALNLISSLILEIDAILRMRSPQEQKTPSRMEIINYHFDSLLSIHFLRERSVRFYANLLNISPKYLTSVTKFLTGKTAGQLIDDKVILEARVLLRNPELSIKQIAEILHFSDQFFFSKYFKNSTGISPSAYRSANGY